MGASVFEDNSIMHGIVEFMAYDLTYWRCMYVGCDIWHMYELEDGAYIMRGKVNAGYRATPEILWGQWNA